MAIPARAADVKISALSAQTSMSGADLIPIVHSGTTYKITFTNFASSVLGGLTLTSSTGTLTIGNGKTLTFSNTLTFTGTDSSTVACGAGGTVAYLGGGQTFTSATWNAGVIAGLYGGTGVANSGKTITIGGNFTTSGPYQLTLTQTSNTNVTLPTTGTLSTLAGTESLTNKTLDTPSITGTGVATFSSVTADAIVLTLTGTPANNTIYSDGTHLYWRDNSSSDHQLDN